MPSALPPYPSGLALSDDVTDEPLPLQNHMVDGARSSPHAEADLCALKGGPGRRGAGNPALPIPQDHLSIGANIDEQSQLLPPVKGGGHHAAYRVCAHEARDIGQYPDRRARRKGEPVRACQLHGLPDRGHIGRLHQRPHVQPQQQMVHGGIPHQGRQTDLLRFDVRRLRGLLRQPAQAGADLLSHPSIPMLHFVLDAGDHVCAVGALGIDGAGAGELPPRFSIAEEGHHRGGPHIVSQHVFVLPIGGGGAAPGQDPDLFPLRQLHLHVLRQHVLTGQLLPTVYQHPAFTARPLPAAGSVQGEALLPQGLQQPLPCRGGETFTGGGEGHLDRFHSILSLNLRH